MCNVIRPSVSCAGCKASHVHFASPNRWETDQIGNQSGKLLEPPSAQRHSKALVCPTHRATLAQWQRRQGQARQPRSGLEPLAAD
jgi:hypothetical protein